jgi:ferrochelatase
MDYRALAKQVGVPTYVRVPTVGTHPQFIHGLANLVRAALAATADKDQTASEV